MCSQKRLYRYKYLIEPPSSKTDGEIFLSSNPPSTQISVCSAIICIKLTKDIVIGFRVHDDNVEDNQHDSPLHDDNVEDA